MGNPYPKHVRNLRFTKGVFFFTLFPFANKNPSMWCAFTYQKPFNPQPLSASVAFDSDEILENKTQYFDIENRGSESPQKSKLAIDTSVYHARLFRVVHAMISLYCGARGKITAKSFVGCFRKFIDWRDGLPLPLASEGREPLPPLVRSLQLVNSLRSLLKQV
jgi:hypothetical protein